MSVLKVLILAVVQGFSELLPISSSAHVIVAEKLMGLDPTRPARTLLLVMLHAGTTLSVLVYYWDSWKTNFFSSRQESWNFAKLVAVATACTGVVGLVLIDLIEKYVLGNTPHAQIEDIFGNLPLMAFALGAVGLFILVSGLRPNHSSPPSNLGLRQSFWIGALQGLCLPFRGFSRSGATISTGLTLGVDKKRAEEFSFALAAVLTPLAIIWEAWRVFTAPASAAAPITSLSSTIFLSLLGTGLSFLTGLLALKWLSNWLARGRWPIFGLYCLVFAAFVQTLYQAGF
jgi:undecaprenyl-diphosphatase